MSLQVVINFRVVAESADWIVVDKPAPLIVHPANLKPEPTLLGGLEQLLAYEIQNGASLGIVTRLDRETSGIVLVSKHLEAAREIGKIFEFRQAKKEYLAIVRGWPIADRWECKQPIIRAGELGPAEIWVRQVVDPNGRDCLTRFRVECRFERSGDPFSLIRCFPETGRMHQIRVHLASIGTPIVGDKLYGPDDALFAKGVDGLLTPEEDALLELRRHALHAWQLELPHPMTGEWLKLEAPMPRDLSEFWASLGL